MRDLEISSIDDQDNMGPWAECRAEYTPDRVTVCEFGVAEEVIGLVEWGDGVFEVGIGESLRPYDLLYRGEDWFQALAVFWSNVGSRAGTDSFSDEKAMLDIRNRMEDDR